MKILRILILLAVLLAPVGTPTAAQPAVSGTDLAFQHLAEQMDRCHTQFFIFEDEGSPCNHYVAMGRYQDGHGQLNASQGATTAAGEVHSGVSALKNGFTAAVTDSWGGISFQNGTLLNGATAPTPAWDGDLLASMDLSGATSLSFWARGANGGEKVEFFLGGIPSSAQKVTLCGINPSSCYTTLTSHYTHYTINLAGADLSQVIAAFGWVTNAPFNSLQPGQSLTFFVDEIVLNLPRLEQPRFIQSFVTLGEWIDNPNPALQPDASFDLVMRNTAFAYDNALALLAFTAGHDWTRARLLADAFVYAQNHDREFADGRLTNTYQAGDEVVPPRWEPFGKTGTVRMPGFYVRDAAHPEGVWRELVSGSSTGNMAWIILALLSYYDQQGGSQYLDAGVRLASWVHDTPQIYDAALGGYRGGWVIQNDAGQWAGWKSTEHNIDMAAACRMLYRITATPKWQTCAESALAFVNTMWNETGGYFYTGTAADGVTPNPDPVPLDPQTWSLQAFLPTRLAASPAAHLVDFVENNLAASSGGFHGVDFMTGSMDSTLQPWTEGTGQMAVSYFASANSQADRGESVRLAQRGRTYQAYLEQIQLNAPNGNGKGLVASVTPWLPTGFGDYYFNRLHVGATAWYIFAQLAYNPFQQVTYPTQYLWRKVFAPLVKK